MVQIDFSNAAAFTPLAHLPQAIGVVLARQITTSAEAIWFAARASNLLVFILIAGLAVYLMPWGRLALGLIFLLPFSFNQAATVSADGLNLVLPLLFLAMVLRLYARGTVGWSAYAGLVAMCLTLGLLKQTTPAFTLALLCLFRPLGGGWRGGLMIVLPIVASLATALVWTAAFPFLPGEYFDRGADPTAQLATIVANPVHFFDVVIDTTVNLGWNYWHTAFGKFPPVPGGNVLNWVPWPLALLALVSIVGTSLCDGPPRRNPAIGALFMAIGALTCGGIIAAFWLAFTPPGETIIQGVQGRYLTPAYGFIAIGLTGLLVRTAALPKLRYGFALTGLVTYVVTAVIVVGFYAS